MPAPCEPGDSPCRADPHDSGPASIDAPPRPASDLQCGTIVRRPRKGGFHGKCRRSSRTRAPKGLTTHDQRLWIRRIAKPGG